MFCFLFSIEHFIPTVLYTVLYFIIKPILNKVQFSSVYPMPCISFAHVLYTIAFPIFKITFYLPCSVYHIFHFCITFPPCFVYLILNNIYSLHSLYNISPHLAFVLFYFPCFCNISFPNVTHCIFSTYFLFSV